MNKKIMILGISAVLMLVTISFASAINSPTNVEKKESPLFELRAKRAVGEKISSIFEHIKTKFLGERIIFLPFIWSNINDNSIRIMFRAKTIEMTCSCTVPVMTCNPSGINPECCTTALPKC